MNTKWKVILAVMLLITVICSVFGILVQRQHDDKVAEIVEGKHESAALLADTILSKLSQGYQGRIIAFSSPAASPSRKLMIQAFADRDREKLLQLSKPLFDVLEKENPYFNSIGWILPDNHVFLRLKYPEKFGDNVSKVRAQVWVWLLFMESFRITKGLSGLTAFWVKGAPFLSIYRLQEEIFGPEGSALNESENKTTLPTGNERILVVDDEPLLVKINEKQLEICGYTVTGTTDSRDALEKIRAQPEQFDLLITDQTMPRLSGVELAKEVHKIRPELPIILCTGHSDVVSKKEALALGIKKYVPKPIKKDELFLAIRDALDGK